MELPRVTQVFFAVLAASCCATTLPKTIQPCKVDDNLDNCILRRANEAWPTLVKGDPSRRLGVLDPLLVTEMKSENGKGNLRLTMVVSDVLLTGFKDLKVVRSRVDLKNKRMEFELFVPKLHGVSRYKIDGVFLVLPIQGSGPLDITLINVRIPFKIVYTLVKKNDVQLVKIVKTEVNRYNITDMSVRFENLFNGNKLLSDNMNLVINENWQEMNEDLGPPFALAMNEVFRSVVEAVIGSVPYKDVFAF